MWRGGEMGDDDEVAILVAEIDRLKEEAEGRKQPCRFVRLWRRLFGKLVYGGPPTCAHCKYWKSPGPKRVKIRCTSAYHDGKYCSSNWHWAIQAAPSKGDCKLLFGEEDTGQGDTCDRFKPRRRYKHRVRAANR